MWDAGAHLQGVRKVADAAHDEEGGGGVQAGADLVQEQRVLGAHHHLAWHRRHGDWGRGFQIVMASQSSQHRCQNLAGPGPMLFLIRLANQAVPALES